MSQSLSYRQSQQSAADERAQLRDISRMEVTQSVHERSKDWCLGRMGKCGHTDGDVELRERGMLQGKKKVTLKLS